jgi:beta-galactosidase
MFCTPTATMPMWLVKKDPSVLSEDENGLKRNFGGRRQACLSSPTYREHSRTISREFAKHYKDEKSIVAWQIDNELGHEGSDICYCDHCENGFQKYLQEQFNDDIDKMNDELGTVFWSQTYTSFDEVNIPRPTIPVHNPGIMMYFYRFRANLVVEFIDEQVQILKQYIPADIPVMHNYPGDYFTKAQDHFAQSQKMDVVALNNYPVWGGLPKPVATEGIALKLAQTRSFLKKCFWITEQLIGSQAHNMMGYLPRPKQATLWSHQAMAHGCDNMIYFRWRTATKGAEQFCYGVLDHDNELGYRYHEMQEFFKNIKKYKKQLNTPIKSKVAVFYDIDNLFAWRIQPQSKVFDIQTEFLNFYKPFHNLNISTDVVSAEECIDDYDILLLPAPMLLTDDTVDKLSRFINKGGTVISGFRAAIKEKYNEVRFNKSNPLYDLAGIKVEFFEALETPTHIRNNSSKDKYESKVWRDIFTCTDDSESICSYDDEFSKYTAISKRNINDGSIYYIGSSISDKKFWLPLAKQLADKYDIPYMHTPDGLEAVVRGEGDDRVIFFMNHHNTPCSYLGINFESYDSKIINYSEIEDKIKELS